MAQDKPVTLAAIIGAHGVTGEVRLKLFGEGVDALSRYGSFNDGARALLVMTAAVLTDLPGVVMLFAPRAICVMPGENAARFGMTPLQDQQLAGLLMWVPANLVFFAIATWLFARWIREATPPARGADYAQPSR